MSNPMTDIQSTDDVATCPDCLGRKVTGPVFLDFADGHGEMRESMRCPRCKGSGVVPKQMLGWIVAGRKMRSERLTRQESLRDEATRRGMTCVELSQMEQGHIEPKSQATKGAAKGATGE